MNPNLTSTMPFTVEHEAPKSSFLAVQRVAVSPEHTQPAILAWLRSEGRKAFQDGWLNQKHPGYGMSPVGGPYPEFKSPDSREVVAYRQEFRVIHKVG